MERAEDRADRFGDYSERRMNEADRAKNAVSAIADNIPCAGITPKNTPAETPSAIENGMRKALDLWQTSKYWTERAEAAVRHAKYKELPAVRARRIKRLEVERRSKDRDRSKAEMWLRLWNSIDNPDSVKRGGQQIPLEERARYIANHCHLTVASSEEYDI